MMREAGGLYVTAALLAAEAWGFIHDPWRVVLTLEEAYLIADLLSTEELQRQLLVDRWRLLEGVRRLSLQVLFSNWLAQATPRGGPGSSSRASACWTRSKIREKIAKICEKI